MLGDARQSVRAELDHGDRTFSKTASRTVARRTRAEHAEEHGAAAVHVHRICPVVIDTNRGSVVLGARREVLGTHHAGKLGPVKGLRDVRGDAGVEAGLQPRAAARGVRGTARAARERPGQALRRRVRRASRAAGRFSRWRLPGDRIRVGREEVRRGLEEHGGHLLDARITPPTDIERDAVNAQGGALAHVDVRGGAVRCDDTKGVSSR